MKRKINPTPDTVRVTSGISQFNVFVQTGQVSGGAAAVLALRSSDAHKYKIP